MSTFQSLDRERPAGELEAFLERLADPAARFDETLRCSWLNAAAARLGWPSGLADDWAETLKAQLEAARKAGVPVEAEHTIRLERGRTIILEARAVPEPTRGGVVLLARDVTAERTAQREAERASARTERLQAIAGSLTQALTPASVARVMLTEGKKALGASSGALALVEEGQLAVADALGATGEAGEVFRKLAQAEVGGPLIEAARGGEPSFLESPEHWQARYGVQPPLGEGAWLAVPLTLDGRLLGALGYGFPRPRRFSREARDLALSLARQCATSLERAQLYDAERAAREEAEEAEAALSFLEEASTVLAASLDHEATMRSVARLAVPVLADFCAVDLSTDAAHPSEVRRVALAHADPVLERLWHEAAPGSAPHSAGVALQRVLRTGEPEVHPHEPGGQGSLSEAQLLELARSPAEVRMLRAAQLRSAMIVPLRTRGRTLGALTLGSNGRRYGQADLALAEELARRGALAGENARLYEAAERARRRAETVAARTARLQATTAALAGSATAAEVAAVLVEHGGLAVSARRGAAYRVADGGTALELLRAADPGPEPEACAARLQLDERAPLSDAVRLGQPVFKETATEAVLCVPLEIEGRAVGGLSFSFEGEVRPDEEARAFLLMLARLGAQALDRARLYEEAERSRTELAQAVRARDEFLSIASHELKTPLSALHLHVEGLRRSVLRAQAPLQPEHLLTKLTAIEEQIDRQTKLVKQLLDVSRITAGRLELELEECDLLALTRGVLARFADQAAKAGCPLTVAGEEPVIGRWDKSRLDQVVTNLLSNAIKYGQGRPIEVTVRGSEAAGRVTVRDHGIGIAAEHQARIFERFERAVSGRHYGGFGLGLWISREIVEALGGSIAVESRPGSGAAFTVELPRIWEATPLG